MTLHQLRVLCSHESQNCGHSSAGCENYTLFQTFWIYDLTHVISYRDRFTTHKLAFTTLPSNSECVGKWIRFPTSVGVKPLLWMKLLVCNTSEHLQRLLSKVRLIKHALLVLFYVYFFAVKPVAVPFCLSEIRVLFTTRFTELRCITNAASRFVDIRLEKLKKSEVNSHSRSPPWIRTGTYWTWTSCCRYRNTRLLREGELRAGCLGWPGEGRGGRVTWPKQ